MNTLSRLAISILFFVVYVGGIRASLTWAEDVPVWRQLIFCLILSAGLTTYRHLRNKEMML